MKILATILAFLGAVPALAQAPPSVGTAAALAGTAVTEARRADAPLWNPALVGIHDGHQRSYSALSLDAARIPGGAWLRAADRLGTVTGRARTGGVVDELGAALPTGGPASVAGQVVWFAAQARDLAVSLSSHFAHRAELPPALARALGAPASGVGTGIVTRASASVLSAARGTYLGRVPLLGQLWVGGTAKGWYAHDYAAGRFVADLPAREVYEEISARGVAGLGADVGLAGRAGGRFRYGVSISNVVQRTFAPPTPPRARWVTVTSDATGGWVVEERHGPAISTDDPDIARASRLYASAVFPSEVRAGAAVETGAGVFAGAVHSLAREGGLASAWRDEPVAVSWSGPRRMPLRASIGWGNGGSRAAIGVAFGPCDHRWVISAARGTGDGAPSHGVSASLAVADRSCRGRE